MPNIRFDCQVGYFTAADQTENSDFMPTNSIDLSTRVMSMTVNHRVNIGEIGRSSCEVIFDNSDGEFTPAGGGTYEDWDWFASLVKIRSRLTDYDTSPGIRDYGWMFQGLISDVEYDDDGFTSQVKLTLLDAFSILSRYVMEEDVDMIGLNKQYNDVIYDLSEGTGTATIAVADRLPAFGGDGGASNGALAVDGWLDDDQYLLDFDISQGDFLGDAIEDLIAAEGALCWPMFIDIIGETVVSPTFTLPAQAFYTMPFQPHNGIRGQSHDKDWNYTFPDVFTGNFDPHIIYLKPSTATMGDHILPYRDLQLGFNVDEHVNQVLVNNGVDEAYLTDSTAVTKYGARAMQLTSMPLSSSDTSSEARCEDLAQGYLNKFSSVDFTVQSVSISGKMIEQYVTGWLDVELLRFTGAPIWWGGGGVGRAIAVTYSPAGLSERTDYVVFKNQTAEITPQDWTITLSDGVKATNFINFIFDDPLTGVLGTGRLAGAVL